MSDKWGRPPIGPGRRGEARLLENPQWIEAEIKRQSAGASHRAALPDGGSRPSTRDVLNVVERLNQTFTILVS